MFRVRGLLPMVEYHQFFLQGRRSWHEVQFSFRAPLLEHTDGVVVVSTGIAMGVLDVELQILDGAPARIDDARGWEAVAEVSAEFDAPHLSITCFDPAGPEFSDLPLPRPAGWYRVRAHAVGRDIAFDGVVRDVCGERHLIQVWPESDERDPVDLRVDDPWRRQGLPSEHELPPQVADEVQDGLRMYDDLIDAVLAAPPEAQWSVAEWAAAAVLRSTGLSDEPGVRAALESFARERPFRWSAELDGVLDQAKRDWENARRAGRGARGAAVMRVIHHPARGRVSALRALAALQAPDPAVAALRALIHAVQASEVAGVDEAFAAEAERLLKIWPAAWRQHARPVFP